MKKLYIYTDGNQPQASDALRQATASLNPIELRLDHDFRKHNTQYSGVEAVIELSDGSILEVPNPGAVVAAFTNAPDPVPLHAPVAASPQETRAQAILKKGEGNLSAQDRDALLIYLAAKVAKL
jgi:hypothetical protein